MAKGGYGRPKPRPKPKKWSLPNYEDIRFGFEVTMYINHR